MTAGELAYFKSPAGLAAYQEYAAWPLADLERALLKKERPPFFSALVSLIKLRRLARGKFTCSDTMFFTSLSLSQATSERIARHLADRFAPSWRVTDLTCGLGGNAIFLAARGCQVTAVDLDPEKILLAQENAAVYGMSSHISFVTGDAAANILPGTDAFFLDPARDRPGLTKTRSFLNSRPSLLELWPRLTAVTPNIAVKISPAFAYEELTLLPETPEVEVIAEDNNCKVAMLWFGAFKTATRRATGFKAAGSFSLVDQPGINLPLGPLQDYLYEPDKAISKAHLIAEAAVPYNLTALETHLSLLTGPLLTDKQALLMFRRWRVVAAGDFSLKKLARFLKEKQITRAEIIAKHFPLTADEARQRLHLGEGGALTLFLTALPGHKKYFILAEKIE